MKRTISTLMLLTVASFGTVPVSFSSGTPAKAADMNANFAALDSAIQKKADQTALSKLGDTVRTKADTNWVNRAIKSQQTGNLDSLVKALGSQLASLAASLQNLQAKESNDSLAVRAKIRDDSTAQAAFTLQNLPQGSVIGLLTAPGVDGYLAGSNSTWLLAAGQGKVNGVTVPDLRGVFLRGLELAINVAGSPAGYVMRDPDGVRTVGIYQGDALQPFKFGDVLGNHIARVQMNSGTGTIAPNYYGPSGGAQAHGLIEELSFVDGGFGPPRIASETRPKNDAVYWFVKVK